MIQLKQLAVLTTTALLLALGSASCLGPKGATVEEKRAYADNMRDHALNVLCADAPGLKLEIEKSAGYAVFSNFSIHPGLLSFASGYGVLTNKTTGKETPMKWLRLTIGPGLAVKGLYLVSVFSDPEMVAKFEEGGHWVMGGQAEASFVFGSFGGGLEKSWVFREGVDSAYTTHTGVSLELEIFGIGRVWVDDELNKPTPEPAKAPPKS